MPVPVSSLVAARLSGVYLMGLMYSAVVILPAVVVYWATVGGHGVRRSGRTGADRC